MYEYKESLQFCWKNYFKKIKKKDVYGENMVNMEKEDIVAKKKEYVMEQNAIINGENANMLEKSLKYLKKNIHVLYIHMEINQVEENYVVNGKIIVPE